MKYLKRSLIAIVLSAAMLFSACSAGSLSNRSESKSPTSAALTSDEGATQDTNSLRFVVNGDFEDNWNNAVSNSKSKGKQVYFILDADWNAPTSESNHPFGADSDGFSYGRITVPAGADIVLDLNGHTINRALTTYTWLGSVICVNGGKLTIEDSAGGGTITGGFTGEFKNWSPDDPDHDYGGGIMMADGELTLNGGSISGNRADCGGGINVSAGKFVMNGGSITNNIGDRDAGGIEFDSGTDHEINGGEISYNKVTATYVSGVAITTSVTGGGGFVLYGGAQLTMNGGKITHNYSAQDGGGGYLYANTTFVINGGEISYNESVRNEGAVSLENPSTMEMNGGVITENISGAYTAVAPGSSTTIRIGGPVKFYNNYDSSGNQANLRITKASMVTITAPIVSETGSAFVGITTTLANGTTLTSGFKTNGKYFDYSADIATAFFSDDTSRYIIENSAKTELVTRTGSTGYVDIDWQYQLDNSGVWQSTDGAAYLDLTYGSKVTAVRACVPSDSNAVASDWQEGGSNPTYSFAYYSSPSGASNTTAFNSIQDVGLYTFAMDTFGSYWLTYNNGPSTGVWILFPASFTINISPKPVTINLIDKGSSYGDKIADLYAEEDILDNEGNPTGATIKPEVDPLTPLVGADAGYDLSSFVTISTEAVASSDLGSYNIKGAIKSSAPFDTKNYSFTIKTASYGIGVATITAAISGSNTYNGSAQNSATITFTYPNGSAFAGTKLSTLDYKVNYPTAGCVNVKVYDENDITIELNDTTNASRFEIAEDGVSGSYEIKKAALSCTADAKSVGYGDDAPEYTVTYSGFKGNDTADTVIKGTLEFACDYTSTSPAGEYTITPSGVTADNYEITFKTGKLTVGTGSIAKPTITPEDSPVYSGEEQTFTVSGYNSNAIKTVTLSDSTNFTWDADTATIKGTKAGSCTVTFALDTDSYKWSDDTVANYALTIEIKPMPLVFSFTATGDENWVWEYHSEGSISYTQTANVCSDDNIALAFKYYLTSNSGTKTPISGTSLNVSNLAAGNYTVEVTLVANGETGYSADNKNYTIDSNSKNTQAFKIDAGGADTSGLVWSYQKDDNPSANLFGGEDGAQTVIKYALKSDGSASVYKIPAPEIPTDYNYLSIDTTKFTGGLKTVKVENGVETEVTGGCSLAGEYKTYVALKTTSNFLFDEGDATSTDRLEGVAVISWTISKAEVDLSGLKLEYGWVNDDTGEIDWVEYSADNPPTFKDAFVSIRVKSGVDGASYPAGIVNVDDIATNNYLTDRDIPGTVSATAKFTLDSNYVYVDSNEVTHEGTFNYVVSIELAKKKIPVSWTLDTIKDANGEEVLDDNGLPYQIYVLDFGADTDGLSQYVKYEYYYADVTDPANPVVGGAVPVQTSGTTTNGQLDYLIDVDGAGKVSGTSTKTVSIFVRAVIDTSVTGSEYYELNLPAGTYAEEYTKLGQKKTLVSVDIHKEEIEYGTEISNLGELYEIKKNNSIYSANSYTALIYAPNSSEGVNISDFDFATADVGEYIIKFALKASVSESDALNKTSFTLTIVAKEIEIPEISVKIEFNGETLNFADYLDGKYKEYLDAGIISAVSGRATAREANTSYVAVIEIINPNYKWKLPSGDEASATRALMRASLTADALSNSVSVDGVQKVATYNWFIAPYKLTTDIINTSGKDGAVINVNKLPEWVRELITDGSLTMGVAYYADEAATSPLTDDEIVLKGGRSYFVGAVVDGEERGNFTFATDDSVVSQSKAITYKVPQSGASALMNNVKEFMTKTFLGLPYWVWALIALAVIILLIIIIAVACKRRKTKEQREELKAKKEEEKQRREEERQRREEERQAQKERLEAERELAKAKQEAELEKIRMQAGMAGAGMASMAMQQQMPQQPAQQQQQPVQQSMPQQPAQQQPAPYYPQPSGDMALVLAKIEAELAQIRAEQHASHGYSAPTPVYGPQPANSDASAVMLAKMEAEFAKMQAKQEASQEVNAAKMELEFYKLHGMPANYGGYGYNQFAQQSAKPMDLPNRPQNYSAEEVGAIMAAMMRNMGVNPAELPQTKPAELPQSTEEGKNSASASYPPDAVITTTTTVDTTKNGNARAKQTDDGRLFDIDGFYDNFENK